MCRIGSITTITPVYLYFVYKVQYRDGGGEQILDLHSILNLDKLDWVVCGSLCSVRSAFYFIMLCKLVLIVSHNMCLFGAQRIRYMKKTCTEFHFTVLYGHSHSVLFRLLLLEVFRDFKTMSLLTCGWKGEVTMNSLSFLRMTASSTKCAFYLQRLD